MAVAELQVFLSVVETIRIGVFSDNLLLLLVFLLQSPPQQVDHDDIHEKVAKCKAVTQNVSWSRLWPVQLRAQHSSKVTNGNLHGVGSGTLGLSRDVDGGPTEY